MAGETEQGAAFEARVRVRYAETDQMGVVYHANYYVWMEIARVELVRSLGLNYRELEAKEGLYLAVTETQCRYLTAARYDDEVAITARIAEGNPRILVFRYELKAVPSGQLVATGMTRHMWLNRDWRPTRLPVPYQQALGIA